MASPKRGEGSGGAGSSEGERRVRGLAAPIRPGARPHLLLPALSPLLCSSKSRPGKEASWRWWRERKQLFSFSTLNPRFGQGSDQDQGQRRRVGELRRGQGPIHFCPLV